MFEAVVGIAVMANEGENLVGQVFFYLSRREYPEYCSASRKRVIRRKATKFQVKDGELFYLTKVKKKF